MGRSKIEIKKIENEEALQVCFSKRRTGAFKKASELATLCGAEVALVVFSPAGRPYSLGLPDMDTVLNRFLLLNMQPQEETGESSSQPTRQQRTAMTRELNKRLMELRSLLDQHQGRRGPIEANVKSSAERIGISDPGPNYEGISLDRLVQLKDEMLQLRGRLAVRLEQITSGPGQSSNVMMPQPSPMPMPMTMPMPMPLPAPPPQQQQQQQQHLQQQQQHLQQQQQHLQQQPMMVPQLTYENVDQNPTGEGVGEVGFVDPLMTLAGAADSVGFNTGGDNNIGGCYSDPFMGFFDGGDGNGDGTDDFFRPNPDNNI